MRAQLLHLSGPRRGHTETFAEREVRIGSAADSSLMLVDPVVTPRHATIAYVEEECAFHLRRGDGQVFVNTEEIEELILQPDDLLEIGIGGPRLRFRVYVPPGSVCKPVRRMLADARDVGRASGPIAAGRTLTRDLLTQATMWLKVGFPLLVLAIALPLAWAAGRLSARTYPAPPTLDSITKGELAELRTRQRAQAEQIEHLAAGNLTLQRIQGEWSRGVCLIHGVIRFVLPDGSEPPDERGQPVRVDYTGSGFLVSAAGHMVTNRHIVEPWLAIPWAKELRGLGAVAEFVHFSATFPGRAPVDVDPSTVRVRSDDIDVAIVRLPVDQIGAVPILPLHQGELDAGDRHVFVVGYPTGLSALLAKADPTLADELRRPDVGNEAAIRRLAAAGAITPMISQGVIGNVQDKQLVYDAATTHGGSGGPVFGVDGTVVAVNYAILEGYSAANFGVPIRFALELLPH